MVDYAAIVVAFSIVFSIFILIFVGLFIMGVNLFPVNQNSNNNTSALPSNLPTISLANATQLYNEANSTLMAELNNPNYGGSFVVPLLQPLYPFYYYTWNADTYLLENASGLKAGTLDVAYKTYWTSPYTYAPITSESYPSIIDEYSAQYGVAPKTTYGTTTCPNWARHALLEIYNGIYDGNYSVSIEYFLLRATGCNPEQYQAYVVG